MFDVSYRGVVSYNFELFKINFDWHWSLCLWIAGIEQKDSFTTSFQSMHRTFFRSEKDSFQFQLKRFNHLRGVIEISFQWVRSVKDGVLFLDLPQAPLVLLKIQLWVKVDLKKIVVRWFATVRARAHSAGIKFWFRTRFDGSRFGTSRWAFLSGSFFRSFQICFWPISGSTSWPRSRFWPRNWSFWSSRSIGPINLGSWTIRARTIWSRSIIRSRSFWSFSVTDRYLKTWSFWYMVQNLPSAAPLCVVLSFFPMGKEEWGGAALRIFVLLFIFITLLSTSLKQAL